MTETTRRLCVCVALVVVATVCESMSYLQRGAGLGALSGAGIGALIGHATHHTAAGALIGTGVGAVAGSAVGSALDNIEAKNRADISAQLGREVDPAGATTTEVLAMSRAGVDPQLIINYVNTAGMVQPLTCQDVIYLHDQGFNCNVIQAMQACCVAGMPPEYVRVVPPTQAVIIEDDPWGCHCCYPHYGLSYGIGCGCH